MKITRQLLFLTVAMMASIQVYAEWVPADKAREVAINYLSSNGLLKFTDSPKSASFEQVASIDAEGLPAVYVFSSGSNNFILVAADNVLTPVLGYSFESEFPARGTNLNFDSFINSFINQVKWARTTKATASQSVLNAWNKFSVQTDAAPREVLTVGPYLTCMWNQNSPYNEFCPADSKGPGGNVYAGCVATAMSMIMNHYRYPAVGKGKHGYVAGSYGIQSVDYESATYHWDAMQSTISTISGEGIPACATLQYHAGVSVDMDYGYDGSGAFSEDVPTALKDHFRYSYLTEYLDKSSYSNTTWEGILLEELDLLKPLYYGGQNSTDGHAFVCDGYQQTDSDIKFHFNFGWGGSANGYYTAQDPDGFKSGQKLVRNMVPGAGYPSGCSNKKLTYLRGSFEDGSGPRDSYNANLACTWLITPADSVNFITLSFLRFEVDRSDTLYIFDGPDETYPRLAAYTGDSIPKEVKGTRNQMFVKFSSGSYDQANGWLAEYTGSAPAFCSGIDIITEPEGTISDGSNNHNYQNNANCQFKIQPPGATDLTLTFTEFDLEPKDMLTVYINGTSTVLGEFTGSTLPPPVSVPSGGLFVRFKTDSYSTSGGFKATYAVGNVSNKTHEPVSSLSISPNPASDNIVLRAISDAKQWLTVTITDMTGKILMTEKFEAGIGLAEKRINTGKLNPGMYLIRILNSRGESSTRKIIIRNSAI